jgi:hypothetical protein
MTIEINEVLHFFLLKKFNRLQNVVSKSDPNPVPGSKTNVDP